MTAEAINEIIAERTLTRLARNGNRKQVVVRLGKPQPSSLAEDYYCPVQIVGLGTTKVSKIIGLDAFQSLQRALKYISFRLQHSREKSGLILYCWEQGDDMGFPEVP